MTRPVCRCVPTPVEPTVSSAIRQDHSWAANGRAHPQPVIAVPRRWSEALGDTVLILAAIVVTIVGLARLVGYPPARSSAPSIRSRYVRNWRVFDTGGAVIGPATATVRVVEFGDFECPACRVFALTALRGVLTDHPNDVSVRFRNWPLSYHPFARSAAAAAICADRQGRFAPFFWHVYSEQDSLGRKSDLSYARESGVLDTSAFRRCLADSSVDQSIETDVRASQALALSGTPSILLQGTLYAMPPDSAEFANDVAQLLKKAK